MRRIRALWLQPRGEDNPQVERLRSKLAANGLLVYSLNTDPPLGEACRSFELVILRVSKQTLGEVVGAVHEIRASSLAPILVLTNQPRPEWSLDLLPAGVDALLSLTMPEDIIIAHCAALVRRWLIT
jgi:hypothetical protein